MLKKYNDPILSQRAEPVAEITPEIHQLVDDILQVMEEHGAIGLSACHIGVLLRVIVIKIDEPIVYINPKLSDPSKEKEIGEEGSISLPGIRVPIERLKAITVEAQDLKNQTFSIRLEGLYARVVMHENDQLNGLFFLSRLPKAQREQLQSRLRSK